MNLTRLKTKCDESIDALRRNMAKLKAGKANPAMVEDIQVEYYGALAPIKNMASVTVAGGNCIIISPWDASNIKSIEKGIAGSNLGLTPNNDGEVIRITVPPLTVDRGKELAKVVKQYGEEAKIAIRGYRQEANKQIDKDFDRENAKKPKSDVQDIIDKYVKEVDEMVEEKNKDFTEFKSSVREVMGG